MTQSGGSSYKLKDHSGKVAKDRKVKQELDAMLAWLNIQVDNPIAILTQDSAKTFLFKCDPHKLYDFFMRATQLQTFLKDVTEAQGDKNVAEELLSEKEDGLPHIKTELAKWEKQFQVSSPFFLFVL